MKAMAMSAIGQVRKALAAATACASKVELGLSVRLRSDVHAPNARAPSGAADAVWTPRTVHLLHRQGATVLVQAAS